MSRHYDHSTNLPSTSDRLPNFSQILDLDMNHIPLSHDQFSSSELNTTSTPTRSDNPAAVLRALLSRLPAHPPSPTQSHTLSVQGGTERESDFDTVSEPNAALSIAQESLRNIVSKALRDPGNTPQKARHRRNSIDTSEVEATPRVEEERAKNKGKRRSTSDDEFENTSQSINRRSIRLKSTPQPVTLEFLRERFSDSHNITTSKEPQNSPSISSNHNSSNSTTTILRNLNSSQATPPAATSTPQQSLRLSSSRFEFHSNLLDQNSEMQKAIQGPDSYDEDASHGQTSTSRPFNPSKTLQTSPVLHHQSSKSSFKPKPILSGSEKLTRHQSHSMDNLRTPSQPRERLHADLPRSPSPAKQLNYNETNTNSKLNRVRSSISHSERHLYNGVHSTNGRLSPLPRTEIYRHHSPSSRTSSPVGSLKNDGDDYVDVVYERQRNWNSPHPIWHKPPPPSRNRSAHSSASTLSPTPTTNGHTRENGFRTSKHLNEYSHDHHDHTDTDASHISNPTTTGEQAQPPHPSSPSQTDTTAFPSHPSSPSQTDTTAFPSTPTRNKASRSLRNEFKTPSPPKGLPDLPTPSSSDESDRDSPHSNQLATGSYLKTPARMEATHSSQSLAKTPKPPGGWVSTPAPNPISVSTQSIPINPPLDIPERSQGLLTPVASLSKGSNLELKTPAVPGAWLATPAVKKSILKVRFEPEVSTLTDKSVKSADSPDPSFDSAVSVVNGDDGFQQTEQLISKSPPSTRKPKLPKSPKIRVLDAFGREQESDVSIQECANSSPTPLRVVDAMGHEINQGSHLKGAEGSTSLSSSTLSRGELLSRIRNGLDDLVVGLDDFDKDNQPLSIDHDELQQLTTISSRARGLRERLYSQIDNNSRSFPSSTLDTKASWFPGLNPKVCTFLIILQLSLIWLMYRISMNWAQELWLNRYYDPFNPELHLYISKSEHVLHSEGARTTSEPSFIRHMWNMWIYFVESIQFYFWQAWGKGSVLQYHNTWTPT